MTTARRRVRVVAIAAAELLVAAMASGCCCGLNGGWAWAAHSAAVCKLGSSFAWMSGPDAPQGSRQTDDPQLRGLIYGMVEEGLTDKGYEKVSSDNPDFWICCRVTKEILGDPNAAWGFSQYTQGTLVVYIVEPETGRWLWKGWAQARLEPANSPGTKRERLQNTVDRILCSVPRQGKTL